MVEPVWNNCMAASLYSFAHVVLLYNANAVITQTKKVTSFLPLRTDGFNQVQLFCLGLSKDM